MLSIIVPAYNEENTIGKTIRSISAAFREAEIIVVADGNDGTGEAARSAAGKHAVRVISPRKRIGKWGSIRIGIMAASGDAISFVDADLSVPAEEAGRLTGLFMESGCDVLVASRYKKGSEIVRRQPLPRIIMSRIFNLMESMMFGLTIRDTQCGFKVFGAGLGKKAASMMSCTGFEGDVEFIWLCGKLGGRICEEPVRWENDSGTTLGLFHMLKTGLGLAKARIRWLLSPGPSRVSGSPPRP